MTTLSDLASGVRSKNAEPFFSTIDIYFTDHDAFIVAKESGSMNKENIAALYNIPVEAVYGVYFVDAVDAAKVTLFKYDGGYLGQGDPALGDIFGAQQYIPLLDLEIGPNEETA